MEFGQSFLQSRRRLCPFLSFMVSSSESLEEYLRVFYDNLRELIFYLLDNSLITGRKNFDRRQNFLHLSAISP